MRTRVVFSVSKLVVQALCGCAINYNLPKKINMPIAFVLARARVRTRVCACAHMKDARERMRVVGGQDLFV